jgi:hypothetical protein
MNARTNAVVKPVYLDRGNVLRIVDGPGLRVTPASGVLWVTEQNSANDQVLMPGRTFELERPGLALVLAHRPAQVMVELPAGIPTPERVEIAFSEGGRGRRVVLRVAHSLRLDVLLRFGRRLLSRLVTASSAPRGHDWAYRHVDADSPREMLERRFPYPYC